MEFYKIENLWLCKLTAVSRREDDQRMTLYDDDSMTFLLLWKEDTESSKTVVDFTKYCMEKGPKYFNFSGQEFYHGTMKAIFTPADIDKIFVTARTQVPSGYLSAEEIRLGEVSRDRVMELAKELRHFKF